MEQLRRIRADIENWVSRLSPRERTLVSIAAAGAAFFILVLVWAAVSSAIDARESAISTKTAALSRIGKLSQGYGQVQAERQALEGKLKSQTVPLMSFISQTGTRLGIEVNDIGRPVTTPNTAGGIQEETVEVNLPRLEIGKLAKLLEQLEASPTVLAKVRRLNMRTRNDDPMRVDVTLVVATYRLKT
jgi:general secretion pathway protein M